ncbi:lipoprotein [Candidatus Phycosocius spiralis]|uniref:Lipoprotein n=2 Tax=Candidatus Phycosocius spiralis TaxID=2815099 RepID=A0ABQ4PT92_9PROT|nr:lipoprotein [Candidatus Phycosocius spiralis]
MCELLAKNPGWEDALRAASVKWKVNPGAILAVIDYESRFRADAKGQGGREEKALGNYGFTQANLRTWNWFLRDTKRAGGSRSDFGLAVDFVGWHFATMERRIKSPRHNVANHYLAYKLGEGGYQRGASAHSRQLAYRIEARAKSHDLALRSCGFGAQTPDTEQASMP